MPFFNVASDNKNDLFDLPSVTHALKTSLHTRVHQGNNHAVSLPKINRAFNTVIKIQSEI